MGQQDETKKEQDRIGFKDRLGRYITRVNDGVITEMRGKKLKVVFFRLDQTD